MVSPTKQSETRRKNKVKKMGRARKNALNNNGSTKTHAELFKLVEETK